MLGLGIKELVVILLIILLLFGASRLPGIAKAMGKSLKEFKKAANDQGDDADDTAKLADKEEEKKE